MNIDLSTLNSSQRQAVEWEGGPLLVLAGPGSGKTRVLTYRIVRILEETQDQHFKLLGLTFTNKAAGEMRERLEALFPGAKERCLLTTFHSYCAELLRQHGSHAGLRPDFTILTQEEERASILSDAIGEVNGQYRSNAPLLPFINKYLDACVKIEDIENILTQNNVQHASELAQIYIQYRKKMIENNSLDFGCLVAEALTLLENKRAIRKLVQGIYSHILVDEFQDTNIAQYKILQHLINPESSQLFVVADDDQVIYQWNGASPERITELQQQYSASIVQLPENYRCPSHVISLANKLISYNPSRSSLKKELVAMKPASENTVFLNGFQNFQSECDWVADNILSRSADERTECVILARTRKLLDGVVESLKTKGLEGYIAVRKDEFQSAPMKFLHSALRLANSRQDKKYLSHLSKAFYKLEGVIIENQNVAAQSSTVDGDYLRAWATLVLSNDSVCVTTKECISKYFTGLVEKLDFANFIEGIVDWLKSIEEDHDSIETFNEFHEELEVWNSLVGDVNTKYDRNEVTLHLLLQEIDLNSKTPEPPDDAIRCFTIHGSKGLEFKHVYLIGLVEDQLPSWAALKKGGDSKEVQEERRNCFVAITRTQESLFMTYANNYFGWHKEPSRFLYEMGALIKNNES